MRVELPLPPRGLHPNARKHWRRRAELKKNYRASAGEWAAVARIENNAKPLDAADITLHYYTTTGRAQDSDNLIAWAKTAIDSLVDARLLSDDNRLTYMPPTIQKDKARPRLEIEIEENGNG